MNIKSIHFAPELQTIMGKIYDEGSLNLLRIDIGLNPDGAGLSIGVNGGMLSWTNYVMAEGWLEKFAVDLAARWNSVVRLGAGEVRQEADGEYAAAS